MPVVCLLSFVTGALVMSLEVLAPRLVAPDLGASHVTWTAVLAVFLASLALGNYLGGRWTDAVGRWAAVGAFVLAGLAVAVITWWPGPTFGGLSPSVRTVAVVALRFAPLGIALGLVGPALASAAIARAKTPGRGLGTVAAFGALGSVIGTLATGFVGLASYSTDQMLFAAIAGCAACALIATVMPTAARTARAVSDSATGRWGLMAAFVGFALLVMEVVAGRVVAQRLGSSLDSWTAVIATVLLALAVGNWVGGRLADRADPRVLIGRLLTLGSALVAATLWTPRILTAMADSSFAPWPVVVFVATLLAFGAPAFVFGALHPVIVRAALRGPDVDGRVAGRLYAAGTLGAVFGALLTGSVLVPALGVPLLVVVTAFGLALVAGRILRRYEIVWLVTLLLVGFVAVAPIDAVARAGTSVGLREDTPERAVVDSPYFHIVVEPHAMRWVRVTDFDAVRSRMPLPTFDGRMRFDGASGRLLWRGAMSDDDRMAVAGLLGRSDRAAVGILQKRTKSRMRRMTLDGFVHGFVDLDDPTWLEYDYEVLYTSMVEALRPNQRRMDCFFIGGGCYTLQRHLLLGRNAQSRFVTAEIDPAVTDMARAQLGLTDDSRHEIVHDDARVVLAHSAQKFEFVFGDAFHDLGVPWHLTTREFTKQVHDHLKPGGFYMVNLIDVWSSGRFLRAFLDTLESEFDHVHVLSMAPRDDNRQETFLLVASESPFEWNTLTDQHGTPLRVTRYSQKDIAELRARTDPLVLTDKYAPVEHLLLPVVRQRGSARSR